MQPENAGYDPLQRFSIKPRAVVWGEGLEIVGDRWLNVSEAGVVESLSEEPLPDHQQIVEPKGLLVPGFINAHTHLGDAYFKDVGWELSLRELVAPPHGLKHELISNERVDKMVKAMGFALQEAKSTGTTFFADFREHGMVGVALLYLVTDHQKFPCLILGRPSREKLGDWEPEGNYGFGLPSLNSYYREFLPEVDEFRKKFNKTLAWHLAEVERRQELVELTLEYKPDFVVHGTHLTGNDLRSLADSGIGVVACPRSNFALSAGVPPIHEIVTGNPKAALGTDNAFVNSLDLFRELEFTAKLVRLKPEGRKVPAREILELVTVKAARCLGVESERGWLEEGKRADFFLVNLAATNLYSKESHYTRMLVNRVKSENVYRVYQGGVKVFER
ncbi:MAG: amidohydrolase family protein [Promethearchaeota archaeon]